MRPYPGDLFEHLRAFYVLAAEIERDTDHSFERAARTLRLDPSVLRRRMRTLGSWSGAPLWTGRGSGLRLTGAGRHLKGEAHSLLGQVEALGRGARPDPERLSVGGTGAFIAGLLPEIAESLLAAHPRLTLAVRRVGSEACRAGLRDGELDFGVLRGVTRPRDVRVERLCADRVWLALPTGHPLASVSQLRRTSIAAHPLISFGASSQTRARTMAALESLGASIRVEVEGKAAALECVRRGLGVGLLSLMPSHSLDAPGVVLRDVTSLFPDSWFWAAWPPGRPPTGPVQHMLERLQALTARPPGGTKRP
jgi:DNA-binding transcriptional LysR family regulator